MASAPEYPSLTLLGGPLGGQHFVFDEGVESVLIGSDPSCRFCLQVPGVSPDPVVTWNTEAAANAFIAKQGGGGGDFQAVQLTDEAMDKIAKAMGCPVESMMFEPYPS